MTPYIENLKTYLAEQQINYGDKDTHTIWEMLYWHYMEMNPIGGELVHSQLRELGTFLTDLRLEDNDKVMDLVSDICLVHEKAAFLAGLRVGSQWTLEMTEREFGIDAKREEMV